MPGLILKKIPAGVAAFFLLLVSAQAHLPLVRLETIFPAGAARGTSTLVKVTGTDLDELEGLIFSEPGISAQKTNENQFNVTVAASVKSAIYEVRLRGRFGVSNPRAFAVGAAPEIVVGSTNQNRGTPAPLVLGQVANARLAAAKEDFYTIKLKKGQRVIFETTAEEIDSKAELALELADAKGREVARSHFGMPLDFTAGMDGEYVLAVHDSTFRGGTLFGYRLFANAGAHLDYAWPGAVVRGRKSRVAILGRHLPGGKAVAEKTRDGQTLEQIEVEIDPAAWPAGFFSRPNQVSMHGFVYRLLGPSGESNPLFIPVVEGPITLKEATTHAQKILPPCEVIGRFFPANSADRYRFEAKKGEVYHVEVISERLGTRADPFLLLQRVEVKTNKEEQLVEPLEFSDSEASIGGLELNTASRDPGCRLEAKQDCLYQVEVRDMVNVSDPRRAYVLSVKRETPHFAMWVMPVGPPAAAPDAKVATPWSLVMRRGETMPLRVVVQRLENFKERVEVSISGLPAGVVASPVEIGPGKSSAVLLLSAATNAATWLGNLQVVGKSTGTNKTESVARSASVVWAVPDANLEPASSRLSRDLPLAILGYEQMPVRVEPEENKIWEAGETNKIKLPLVVRRGADTNLALKLKGLLAGGTETLGEIDVPASTNRVTVEIDPAKLKLAPGDHLFYWTSPATVKYRNNPEAAEAALEQLKKAESQLAEAGQGVKAAGEKSTNAASAFAKAEAGVKGGEMKLASLKAQTNPTPEQTGMVQAAENELAEAKKAVESAQKEKVSAEAALKKADANVKMAEAARNKAKEISVQASQRAAPKDQTLVVYSEPVRVRVLPAKK